MRQVKVLKIKEALMALPISSLITPKEEDYPILSGANDNPKIFLDYLRKKLLPDWQLTNELTDSRSAYQIAKEVEKNPPETVIAIAKHYNQKGFGLLIDAYQIFVWIRNKGVGISNIFRTDLHHSNYSEEYILDVRFEIEIKASTEDFLTINFSLINDAQPWYDYQNLLFSW